METIEVLEREHRTARLVASVARRDLGHAARTGVCDRRRVAELVEFFLSFSAWCHGPKEERLLATLLHRHGLAREAPALRELVVGHEGSRILLDSAGDWLRLLTAGAESALQPLLYDLELYLDELERQMADEEALVFPLAQRRLRPGDLEELGRAFAAVADEERAAGRAARREDLARRLAAAPADA
ncbi:MAG: hemerythrin domain-containing protein [Thermoleophilia bacterium]